MARTIISFDYAIKNVLRDKANFDVLEGFLTELLGRKIEVLELLESESNKEHANDKGNKLDLKAKINDDEIAIFEIQADREGDFFQRILYGASKAITEQLSKGKLYEDIKKVYSVDIVYFELGKGSDYIYHGATDFRGVHNNERLMLSTQEEKLFGKKSAGELFTEYYIIYPNKFNEVIKSKFDEWVFTLKTSKVKNDFTAAGIQECGEKLNEDRMTDAERERYEDEMKYRRVKDSEIRTAKRDGLYEGEQIGIEKGEKIGIEKGIEKGKEIGVKEGIEKGRAETKMDLARTLLAQGILTKGQIAEVTGLSEKEISLL